MQRSQIMLITPGLITTQVAFYTETPVIFLPASNDSQYLQLEGFRKLNLARASVSLNDYLPELDILHLPGEESTKLVMKQLRELENSSDLQEKIGKKLNKLVQTRDDWSKKSVPAGKEYIASLGGNGTDEAVEKILEFLK